MQLLEVPFAADTCTSGYFIKAVDGEPTLAVSQLAGGLILSTADLELGGRHEGGSVWEKTS